MLIEFNSGFLLPIIALLAVLNKFLIMPWFSFAAPTLMREKALKLSI